MASVASQLIEEVTAHAQSDSLEDAREICADGTYFPNDLRTLHVLFLFQYTSVYDRKLYAQHIKFRGTSMVATYGEFLETTLGVKRNFKENYKFCAMK